MSAQSGYRQENLEAGHEPEIAHIRFDHMQLVMNSMKVVIPLHSLYWSIHTKDESKRGTAFAFIFGVN